MSVCVCCQLGTETLPAEVRTHVCRCVAVCRPVEEGEGSIMLWWDEDFSLAFLSCVGVES